MKLWLVVVTALLLVTKSLGFAVVPAPISSSSSSLSLWTRSTEDTTTRVQRLAAVSGEHDNDNSESDDKSESDDDKAAAQELTRQFYKFQESQSSTVEPDKEDEQVPLKFTGRSSSSLFSPPTTESSRTEAVEREKRAEFNLAGNFERFLPLQAGLLALCLAFCVYVGISGGITDGSERDFGGYDDETNEPINTVVGDPSFSSKPSGESVWL